MGPRIREHGTAVHDNTLHTRRYIADLVVGLGTIISADVNVDNTADVTLKSQSLSLGAGLESFIWPTGGFNARAGTITEDAVLDYWWDVDGIQRSAKVPVTVQGPRRIAKVNFDEADVNGTTTQNVKNLAPGLAVGVELVVEAEVSIIGLDNQEFQVQFLLKSNTGATLDSFFLHAAATGAGDVFELSGKLKGSITTTVANEQFFVAVAVVLGGATWTVHSHRVYRVMPGPKQWTPALLASSGLGDSLFWAGAKTGTVTVSLKAQVQAGFAGTVVCSDRFVDLDSRLRDIP